MPASLGGKPFSHKLVSTNLGGPVAAAAATPSPVYVTHTSSVDSADVTAPATVNAGDLLVLVDEASNQTGPVTDVIPTNFTGVGTVANPFSRGRISYKIADGSEDSATITGMTALQIRKILIQYRDDLVPIVSLTVAGFVSTIVDTNPAAQTIAASAGTPPVIGITSFYTLSGAVSPRTTSITPDHEMQAGTSTRHYVHDYIQETSPANYTFDMDDESFDNTLMGCYFHNFG